MSSHNPCDGYELRLALVLPADSGKSARIPNVDKDLPSSLVLRGDQQDSAHVAQEIRARDPEGLLRDIPGKRRKRRRERERSRRATRVGGQAAALQTVGGEVVRIAPTPRGLGTHPSRRLAARRGARPLTSPDMSVRNEPATTDAARPLPEHPPMLYASR